jgi:hypothetical protein
LRSAAVTADDHGVDDMRGRRRDTKPDLLLLDVVALAPGLLLRAVTGLARGVGAVVSRVLP